MNVLLGFAMVATIAHSQWVSENGSDYWYENDIRQGTVEDKKCFVADGIVRGREIYDPDTNA